jgi:hypothetical protein
MATPTASGSLDKASFPLGSTMTATVTYGDADAKTGSVTFVVTDAEGHPSTPVTMPYAITDGLVLSCTDTLGKTWTKVSDNGAVAVFTATA